MKNSHLIWSSLAILALAAGGCAKRDFNSGKVKSENSGGENSANSANSGAGDKVISKKTFSCELDILADAIDPATGKIDEKGKPTPRSGGNFEYTLIDTGGDFKIEIRKDYSFSHLASIAAGKPSSEKKGDNLTYGKIVKANLGACQRSHCFRMEYKIWPANDPSKEIDLKMEFWTTKNPRGLDTFPPKHTILIEHPDGSKSLGGIPAHCGATTTDDGVLGLLNAVVAKLAPTPIDSSNGSTGN